MRTLVSKFNQKQFVKNLLIEVTADMFMLALGLGIGYFFKTMYF